MTCRQYRTRLDARLTQDPTAGRAAPLEAHAAACAACRRYTARTQGTLNALAALRRVTVPVDVRTSVMAALAALPLPRRRPAPWVWWAAAALPLAVFGSLWLALGGDSQALRTAGGRVIAGGWRVLRGTWTLLTGLAAGVGTVLHWLVELARPLWTLVNHLEPWIWAANLALLGALAAAVASLVVYQWKHSHKVWHATSPHRF